MARQCDHLPRQSISQIFDIDDMSLSQPPHLYFLQPVSDKAFHLNNTSGQPSAFQYNAQHGQEAYVVIDQKLVEHHSCTCSERCIGEEGSASLFEQNRSYESFQQLTRQWIWWNPSK